MEFLMFMFNVMIAFAVGGVLFHFIERMFDNELWICVFHTHYINLVYRRHHPLYDYLIV